MIRIAVLAAIYWVMLLPNASSCKRCGWGPPRTSGSVTVRTTEELQRAVSSARAYTTVVLENEIYSLERNQLDVSVSGLVVRGKSGDRSKVVLRGNGMTESMVAISVSAPGVTIADLAVTQVGFHGIHVCGNKGASNVVIHNVHVRDVGQQLIKGSTAPGSEPCRNGLVACCLLEYADHAPSDYTNAVDVLNGEGWTVRDNTIRRIRGPEAEGYRAGPAILFWGHSRDTVVERNWLVDCYRGIALGLVQDRGDGSGLDHEGGIIRRNAICNLNPWADEGIEVNASPGTRVEHNTVLVEGKVPWSIGIRFPSASAKVWNNLSNRQIILRDNANADLKANVRTPSATGSSDASRGDLRLSRGDLRRSMPASSFARSGRAIVAIFPFPGSAPDAGALENRGSRH